MEMKNIKEFKKEKKYISENGREYELISNCKANVDYYDIMKEHSITINFSDLENNIINEKELLKTIQMHHPVPELENWKDHNICEEYMFYEGNTCKIGIDNLIGLLFGEECLVFLRNKDGKYIRFKTSLQCYRKITEKKIFKGGKIIDKKKKINYESTIKIKLKNSFTLYKGEYDVWVYVLIDTSKSTLIKDKLKNLNIKGIEIREASFFINNNNNKHFGYNFETLNPIEVIEDFIWKERMGEINEEKEPFTGFWNIILIKNPKEFIKSLERLRDS